MVLGEISNCRLENYTWMHIYPVFVIYVDRSYATNAGNYFFLT